MKLKSKPDLSWSQPYRSSKGESVAVMSSRSEKLRQCWGKASFFWSVGWSDRQVHPKGIQAIKGKNNLSVEYTPSLPHCQGTRTQHCQTLGPLRMSPSLINSAHTHTTESSQASWIHSNRSTFCYATYTSPCLHSQGEKSARLIPACITPRPKRLSGGLASQMAWQCTKILNSPPERCFSLPRCKELHSTLAALSLFVSTGIKAGGSLAIWSLNSAGPNKLQHRSSPSPLPQHWKKPSWLQQVRSVSLDCICLGMQLHPCAASLESTINNFASTLLSQSRRKKAQLPPQTFSSKHTPSVIQAPTLTKPEPSSHIHTAGRMQWGISQCFSNQNNPCHWMQGNTCMPSLVSPFTAMF